MNKWCLWSPCFSFPQSFCEFSVSLSRVVCLGFRIIVVAIIKPDSLMSWRLTISAKIILKFNGLFWNVSVFGILLLNRARYWVKMYVFNVCNYDTMLNLKMSVLMHWNWPTDQLRRLETLLDGLEGLCCFWSCSYLLWWCNLTDWIAALLTLRLLPKNSNKNSFSVPFPLLYANKKFSGLCLF